MDYYWPRYSYCPSGDITETTDGEALGPLYIAQWCLVRFTVLSKHLNDGESRQESFESDGCF